MFHLMLMPKMNHYLGYIDDDVSLKHRRFSCASSFIPVGPSHRLLVLRCTILPSLCLSHFYMKSTHFSHYSKVLWRECEQSTTKRSQWGGVSALSALGLISFELKSSSSPWSSIWEHFTSQAVNTSNQFAAAQTLDVLHDRCFMPVNLVEVPSPWNETWQEVWEVWYSHGDVCRFLICILN